MTSKTDPEMFKVAFRIAYKTRISSTRLAKYSPAPELPSAFIECCPASDILSFCSSPLLS